MRQNTASAQTLDVCLSNAEIKQFVDAGFALHHLHPKSKRPIGEGWSTAPVATLDDLLSTYQDGMNLGVRLGEPSKLVDGQFLYLIDVDIREPSLAQDACDKVTELFGEKIWTFPTVESGSGNGSKHIYFTSSQALASRKLATSPGKFRETDGRWRYQYEIELLGSGRQAVLPPSVHPESGQRYTWLIPFDFQMLEIGLGPSIAGAQLEALTSAANETFDYEAVPPLTFRPGQLESELEELSVDRIDDRSDWITLGQAIHHNYGGSKEGFDLWMKVSSRGSKYLHKSSLKAEYRRYCQFGRHRGRPVTLATVRQWVLDARHEKLMSQFSDVDIDGFEEPTRLVGGVSVDNIDDLLGEPTVAALRDPIDDLLGKPAPAAPRDPIDDIIDGAVASKPDGSAWASLMDFTEAGALRPTLHNLSLILMNDVRFAGVAQLNQFSHEIVQKGIPKSKSDHRRNSAKPTLQLDPNIWKVKDQINGDLWSDDRDADIRRVIEAPRTQGGFGVKCSDRDLRDAISIAARAHPFHPVKDYLNGLSWDGKPRAEELFIKYFGADDTPYSRQIAKLMLLGGVTRIFEPGAKFDFSIVLEGLQGKRKSSWIETLAKHWYTDVIGDFNNQKSMIELLQNAWVIEFPELSGFNRSDVQTIKAFISRKVDRARLAYARRAADFPRQCIFICSTNESIYLKDPTGNRRWWPIECKNSAIDIDDFKLNVDQVWAEALVMYRQMRASQPYGTLPLYLTGEAAETALGVQESRRVETTDDVIAGLIEAWLEKPISDDAGFEEPNISEPQFREQTCLLQIWCEALDRDRKDYGKNNEGRYLSSIMKLVPGWEVANGHKTDFGRYGRQRVYKRVNPAK